MGSYMRTANESQGGMMMDWETKRVFADWDNDVNAEMRRLIKNGVPPYDAVDRARENVSRRRQENGDTVKGQ